jgi:MGT family glycosyltransferase
MSRFLVYTSPAAGHLLPLVPGVLELRRRGHEVRVVCAADDVEPMRAAGIDAVACDPRIQEIQLTDHAAKSDKERLRQGHRDLLTRGRHDGRDLDRHLAEWRPDVLLVDTNAYGAKTRATVSGLPWAILMPSVLPMPGRGIPPYGFGLAPARGPLGRVRDAVLWKVAERVFGQALLPGLNELRQESGLEPFTSPLQILDDADAVICTAGAPLEYARTDLPARVHLVGAQVWDPPTDRPAWLDEPGDPWVLVTCSTDYQGDERLAEVAVEALADLPVRVLVTMADAYDSSSVRSADNVRVERHVPHGHVLPVASAVVCHAGFGIVTRAVAAGVPVVAVPFGRDQPEVARRVVEAGAGVSLPAKRLDAARLRAAVLEAQALRPSASSAGRVLREHGGGERYADAAHTLVTNGHHVAAER